LLGSHPEVPSIAFDYAELTRDPAASVARLVEFLELHPPPGARERAAALVVRGPALRRAIRRLAAHDLTTLPLRYGWVLAKDPREGSPFIARQLTRGLPRETYRILRAAV